MLSLTCRDASTVRLQYMHPVGAGNESPAALRVTATGRSFPLTRLGSVAQGENHPRAESLGTEMPLATLEAAAFVIEASATSGQRPDSPVERSVRLSVQAAAPALGALARHCVSGAR